MGERILKIFSHQMHCYIIPNQSYSCSIFNLSILWRRSKSRPPPSSLNVRHLTLLISKTSMANVLAPTSGSYELSGSGGGEERTVSSLNRAKVFFNCVTFYTNGFWLLHCLTVIFHEPIPVALYLPINSAIAEKIHVWLVELAWRKAGEVWN